MQFQSYGQRENILGILDPDVLWYKSSILSFSFGQTFEMVFDLILSESHHFFDQTIAIDSICQKRKASILIRECGGLVISQATSFRLDDYGEESELGTLEYLFREERHYLFVHEDWEFQLYSAIKLPELIWK